MNDNKSKVILQRIGDPAPVTIDQDKCVIRTRKENRLVDCCAIFNGPNGTALRSYSDDVLVNGAPAIASWLNSGDEIQLPCSTKLAVKSASQYRPFEVHNSLNEATPELVPVEARVEATHISSQAVLDQYADDREEVFLSPYSEDLPAVAPTPEVAQPGPLRPVQYQEPLTRESFSLQAAETTNMQPANLEPTYVQPAATEPSNAAPVFAQPAIPEQPVVSPTIVASASVTPEPVASKSSVNDSVERFANVENTRINETDQRLDERNVDTPSVENVAEIRQPESQNSTDSHTKEIQSVMERLGVITGKPSTNQRVPESPEVEEAPGRFNELQTVFQHQEQSANAQPPDSGAAGIAPVPQIQAVPTNPAPVQQPAVQPPAPAQTQTAAFAQRTPDVGSTPAADSISELPNDLRNQLNDLVSSLDNSPVASPRTEPVPTMVVEPSQPVTPQAGADAPSQPVQAQQPGQGQYEVYQQAAPLQQQQFESPQQEQIPQQEEIRQPEMVQLTEPTPAIQPAPIAPQPTLQSDSQTSDASFPPVLPNANSFGEEARATEPVVQSAETESVVFETPKPVQQSSVADILNNLGMSVPGVELSDASNNVPEPVEPPAQTMPAVEPQPVQESVAESQVASEQGSVGHPAAENEDDIQAYMDRLLNRKSADEVQAAAVAEQEEAAAVAAAPKPEPMKVLSAEEFVPTHRAARHESFEDLREIANSSSRTAIRESTSKARTESVIVKASLFVLSFAGALLSYQLSMIIPAIAFAGAAFATSYLFYQDYHKRKVELSATKTEQKPVANR